MLGKGAVRSATLAGTMLSDAMIGRTASRMVAESALPSVAAATGVIRFTRIGAGWSVAADLAVVGAVAFDASGCVAWFGDAAVCRISRCAGMADVAQVDPCRAEV